MAFSEMTCRLHAGYTQVTRRLHAGYMQVTYRLGRITRDFQSSPIIVSQVARHMAANNTVSFLIASVAMSRM